MLDTKQRLSAAECMSELNIYFGDRLKGNI